MRPKRYDGDLKNIRDVYKYCNALLQKYMNVTFREHYLIYGGFLSRSGVDCLCSQGKESYKVGKATYRVGKFALMPATTIGDGDGGGDDYEKLDNQKQLLSLLKKKNTDGRSTCFHCGTKLNFVNGGFMKSYNYCPKCEK